MPCGARAFESSRSRLSSTTSVEQCQKTTVALYLAAAFWQHGADALVLDLVPQALATEWHDARAEQLPLASRFTLAEQAVLTVVAAETVKRGDCRLCHEHVAATAGVSRSTVKAALRQVKMLGLLTIEERRLSHYLNDTNIVRIVATEWTA